MFKTAPLALAFALAFAAFANAATAADGADWQKAYDGFVQTVAPIQQQLDAKHQELASVMNSANPDKTRIQELFKDIGALQGQLAAANVELQAAQPSGAMPYGMHHPGEFAPYTAAPGMGRMGGGMGMHHGYNRHGGGHHGGW